MAIVVGKVALSGRNQFSDPNVPPDLVFGFDHDRKTNRRIVLGQLPCGRR
jgi:hypothetical protein